MGAAAAPGTTFQAQRGIRREPTHPARSGAKLKEL